MTGQGAYRIEALVLRKTKLKESDLIVTLLAEDGSLVRAVAHGARKPQSPFASRLEPCAVVDVLLARGRSLDVAKEARFVARRFRRFRRRIAPCRACGQGCRGGAGKPAFVPVRRRRACAYGQSSGRDDRRRERGRCGLRRPRAHPVRRLPAQRASVCGLPSFACTLRRLRRASFVRCAVVCVLAARRRLPMRCLRGGRRAFSSHRCCRLRARARSVAPAVR